MLCFLCGKKIGLLRSLVDQQYCCSDHRKEARLASAQALRDEEEIELWAVSKSKRKSSTRYGNSAGQTASMAAFLTVGGLLLAAVLLPGPGGGGPAFPPVNLDPAVKRGLFQRVGDAVGEAVRSHAPVTLHQDFRGGWTGWGTAILHPIDDPRRVDDPRLMTAAAPILRIWNRSTDLQNYQMEFSGALERRSLSWAFRAADERNYYGTKIMITKPGPLPNAGLVHYVVMDGREWDRVQLPLPLTLARGDSYRVRVSVQDDHFITYLNGQVISSWTDRRLHRGGIGFFQDLEDPQKIAWVNLSERDSFMGRMLAHFSLFVIPGADHR
jgi:hypothetical protein